MKCGYKEDIVTKTALWSAIMVKGMIHIGGAHVLPVSYSMETTSGSLNMKKHVSAEVTLQAELLSYKLLVVGLQPAYYYY